MKNKWSIFLLLILLTTGVLSAQQPNAGNRIALVIGVQNYTGAPPLRHSLRDANDMSATLKAKGFKVETLLDPKTKKEIKDAITRYYNTMRDKSGAVGIIYYAGHGTQLEGENYLIPASASLQLPGDLDDQCVKMNLVMSVLNSSNNNLNIFLLDACRTNNFTSFSRDINKGLASIEAPKGSIVVFATQPGTVASDGTGKNGLFTAKLLKYINEPNLNIGEVFRKVKHDVNEESEGKQLPSVVDNSIGGEFYFTKQQSEPAPVIAAPAVTEANKKETLPDPKKSSEPKKENLVQKNSDTPLDYGYGLADAGTVTIGSQRWISKNLNVSTFANGDEIPEAKTPDEWRSASDKHQPAWCYYNNDPANGATFGKLYNWYAVHDPRGLAPAGWHIPTDEEWTKMTSGLGADGVVGNTLKSTSGWSNKGDGSNSSGFTGTPSGFRYTVGKFADIGKSGYWWTSIESNAGSAWCRNLFNYNDRIYRGADYKGCGFSVRCIKD
ncbi:MAG: caspase family protein [Bacteroidetes bacterium]|nr:caspase family protein [Bacteroidota bacterium]